MTQFFKIATICYYACGGFIEFANPLPRFFGEVKNFIQNVDRKFSQMLKFFPHLGNMDSARVLPCLNWLMLSIRLGN